jgi:hypothetical protein
VHVPKLNSFGEEFLANGYALPNTQTTKTPPLSIWASVLAQNYHDSPDRFKAVPNRIELISAGRSNSARLSYFAEWRILSQEFLSDMTLRDRSGRFEDLYVVYDASPSVAVQVGQFRPFSQIDVSRRLNLSEPLVFSSSLAGESDPDPRIQSLRGFSPAGRSPAIKVAVDVQGWQTGITVPFPGEFSIPLSSEAETFASFEFEGDPKGVFVEAFRRNGTESIGAFGFVGSNDRSIFGVAAQQQVGTLWLEGGVARAEVAGANDWRYSLGFDWIPRSDLAAGIRLDHRDAPGQDPLVAPYVSFLKPFGEQAAKLVFEGRFQDNRTPRYVFELGWMF